MLLTILVFTVLSPQFVRNDAGAVFMTPGESFLRTQTQCVCRCEQRDGSSPGCNHGFETAAWVFGIFASIGLFLSALFFVASRLDRIVGAWRRSELPKLPWKFLFQTFWLCMSVLAWEVVVHWGFK